MHIITFIQYAVNQMHLKDCVGVYVCTRMGFPNNYGLLESASFL